MNVDVRPYGIYEAFCILIMKNIANYLTPEVLKTINKFNDMDLIELPRIPFRKIYLIYFLYNNEELVYIGKTTNIYSRITTHKKTKNFNYYSILEVSYLEYDLAERVLINKYLPILNRDNITKKIIENG